MQELQIISTDGSRQAVRLDGSRMVLGRAEGSQLFYPDDRGLSRQHLALEREGAEWYVRDLSSKNGSTLNGVRISGRSLLHPGDEIRAGHLTLRLGDHAPSQEVTFVPTRERDSSRTVVSDYSALLGGKKPAAADEVSRSAAVGALIRAGNELAGERPLPELFRLILDLALEAVCATRGLLMTLEGGELEVRARRGAGFQISSTIRDRVLARKSVLVRDVAAEESLRAQGSIVNQRVNALIAVPLQTRDNMVGLLYVDSPSLTRPFQEEDLSLLTVLANVAAIRIEQVRFAEQEKARQWMERDLEQAAAIQRQFLPAEAPVIPGVDVAGYNAPCRTVGGDYYGFFEYPGGKLAMALGDVCGKGMPASLLMMGLQARLEVLMSEPSNAAALMRQLNRLTSANCPPGRFITLFVCFLDASSGELRYSNAGHNPPVILRSDGSYELLDESGPLMGILPDADYPESFARLERGDLLAIYSDGVTEAETPGGVAFETDRLLAVLKEQRGQKSSAILSALNVAVDEWTEGAPAADDITAIVVRKV